jgi:4-methylaminobutanoate oxidase (formaldehyde-forming)
VGELGWELYIPNNRAVAVWDALLEAGKEFGIEVGGYKVLDALRLEKGYRYFTADVTQLENPYEAGLGFCVHLEKGDFVGRDALIKAKVQGSKRKLCTLLLDGDDYAMIFGGEAIYSNGKVISRVRSGGYGFSLKKNIAYAYLSPEHSQAGTQLKVEIFDQTVLAEVVQTVLFDPKGDNLRA